jgi:hypothetical protein
MDDYGCEQSRHQFCTFLERPQVAHAAYRPQGGLVAAKGKSAQKEKCEGKSPQSGLVAN